MGYLSRFARPSLQREWFLARRKYSRRHSKETKMNDTLSTDPLFLEITRRHMPSVETLETRNRDALDFHDVAVWSIRKSLAEPETKTMKLSDTQRIVLSHGAQHPQLLAIAPKHLPVAACRAVVNSLIKSRLLIEVAAPRDQLAMVWRKDGDGTPILIQVTDEGLRAIGIDPNEGRAAPDTAPQGGEDNAPQAEEQPSAEPAPEAPNMESVNLREAAERLLAAWEETPPANADKDPIARAMDMLRSALSRRGTRATGAPRKPREGTKQEVVLAMLRRPEGATVAQIAEATGWAQHTVRGFFAGLKKRQGITVEIAERIRQVGPNKQGAKGSYTVYRVAE